MDVIENCSPEKEAHLKCRHLKQETPKMQWEPGTQMAHLSTAFVVSLIS